MYTHNATEKKSAYSSLPVQENRGVQRQKIVHLPPTTLHCPDEDSQIKKHLKHLEDKVNKFEFNALIKDCKTSLKDAVKEKRELVKSEKNQVVALTVGVVALFVLLAVGCAAVVFSPVLTQLPLDPLARLALFVEFVVGGVLVAGSALMILEDIGCKLVKARENYKKECQDLKDKTIQLTNLKNDKFVDFVKEQKNISINKNTLTSRKLHNLYNTEKKIEDLKQRKEVLKKYIEAKQLHRNRVKKRKSKHMLSRKISQFQSALTVCNTKQSRLMQEAAQYRKALASVA